MNNENLIPQAHKLTVEEASRGGKASVESRLRKKVGKELVRALLDRDVKDSRIVASLEVFGIPAEDIKQEVAMHQRQIEKAINKADTSAYYAVMKAAGYDETTMNINQRQIIVENEEQKQKLENIQEEGI